MTLRLVYPGQTLTYAVATNPAHGAVSITDASTGAFSYTPNTGYSGTDSFTFTVTDEDGTASNTATESITVTTPVISLMPLSHNFGSIVAGKTSGTQNFTLKNTGNAPLTGISIVKAGPNPNQFTITGNTCPSSLGVGSSPCTISMVFNPSGAGSFSSGFFVTNAEIPSVEATVSGTGVAWTVSLSSNYTVIGQGGSVTLSWSSNWGSGLTYTLQKTDTNTNTTTTIYTGTGTSFTTSLTKVDYFDFRVKAAKSDGSSVWSNTVEVQVQ